MFLKIFLIFSIWYSQNFSVPTQNSMTPNMHIIGDVMLSRSVGAMTKKYGTSYITSGFHPFGDAIKNDFLLLNLESPFSKYDKDIHRPSFTFASNEKNISVLQWLVEPWIGIVSLANNHIFNAGFEGFETTTKILDEAKILHTGLSKWDRKKFLEINNNDKKFCFGAYTYDGQKFFNQKTGETWWVNSFQDAENDIFEMKQSHCDQKIFMLHWGREYRVSPTENQKKLAYFLIDHGATIIVGGHSHILGTKERYKGKWIFYSLWNAIFDQEWGRNGCEPNMDCIFDEKISKNTVPTYIGTKFRLHFPYTDEPNSTQWDIKIWKMIAR